MPDFGNDDIDKMFEQIISSGDINDINSIGINGDQENNSTTVSNILKELNFINSSLSRAINHVTDLILNFMSIENYSIDQELTDILGNIYKLTEDLDEYMIELFLEEQDEDSEDDE